MLAALSALQRQHAVDVLRRRNGIEKRGADPAQNCAVRAYPQGQREHRCNRKARRAAQLPQRVPGISAIPSIIASSSLSEMASL